MNIFLGNGYLGAPPLLVGSGADSRTILRVALADRTRPSDAARLWVDLCVEGGLARSVSQLAARDYVVFRAQLRHASPHAAPLSPTLRPEPLPYILVATEIDFTRRAP